MSRGASHSRGNRQAAGGAATCSCPTCGQSLPGDGELRVDEAGIVVRGDSYALLTQQEHAVFAALRRVSPRVRSREQLLSDLYHLQIDEPGIGVVDVFVCKLRKKLRPLGIEIDTVRGRGYRYLPAAPEGVR